MKNNKILYAIIISIFLISSSVLAVAMPTINPPDDSGKMITVVTTILGYLKWLAFVAAVMVMVFLGIKYITATVNDKADIKNALVMYGIGAIMIAGAFQIVQMIATAFK